MLKTKVTIFKTLNFTLFNIIEITLNKMDNELVKSAGTPKYTRKAINPTVVPSFS